MTASPNMLIVLGPSPESFYVGYGRRHVCENMSPSFTKHASSALNISMTLWIRCGVLSFFLIDGVVLLTLILNLLSSMNRTMEHWVDYNIATDQCTSHTLPFRIYITDLRRTK